MSRGAIDNIVNMLVGCGLPLHVAECLVDYMAFCDNCHGVEQEIAVKLTHTYENGVNEEMCFQIMSCYRCIRK